MQWIHYFQLFLFDLDGLLVNTEELHYMAYQRMCAQRGVTLTWSFPRYCQAAHYNSTALRDQIYAANPDLYDQEPNWDVLYAEKKQAIIDLINDGVVHLMPGVELLLEALAMHRIPRCVVTHSPDVLVQAIRRHNPLLDSIPEWITRHDYTHPKPHPECYLKAIEKFGADAQSIIGFEDTPRGLQALLKTRAKPVLISTIHYPETTQFLKEGASHFSTFTDIPTEWNGK